LDDLEFQLKRVAVDLRAAMYGLHEFDSPERVTSKDDIDEETFMTYRISKTIDLAGIIETLRQLPDGVGTAAFIAAYNHTHPDWRGRPGPTSGS
jgi:hypothetical protein